jgi:hypothetical protein
LAARGGISGNKGDWSEMYAFVTIICSGRLEIVTSDLESTSRYLSAQSAEQGLAKENGTPIACINSLDTTGSCVTSTKLTNKDFQRLNELRLELFSEISSPNTSSSFTSEAGLEIMQILNLKSVSAGSGTKTDITISTLDGTSSLRTRGFSVKSQAGSRSSLVNAGRTTNFEYLTRSAVDAKEVNEIATRNKMQDRLKKIESYGELIPLLCSNPSFSYNLRFFGPLESVIADLLLYYYRGEGKALPVLIDLYVARHPGIAKKHIEFQLSSFLRACALGMTPGTRWTGNLQAHGGYIIVKANGDVVCIPLENDDDFRMYLLKNAELDTADSGRHQFGSLTESKPQIFTLNFAVRFHN